MTPTLTPRQAELLKSLPRDEVFEYPGNPGAGNAYHWLHYKELIAFSHWTPAIGDHPMWTLTPAGRALWDELNKPTREER